MLPRPPIYTPKIIGQQCALRASSVYLPRVLPFDYSWYFSGHGMYFMNNFCFHFREWRQGLSCDLGSGARILSVFPSTEDGNEQYQDYRKDEPKADA
jgi:hypothetical protein